MDILYGDRGLETLCTDERKARKAFGEAGFRKLRARLKDLEAAAKVTDLVAGSPHRLTRDRKGQFGVYLDGGRRLVFEPANEPVPEKEDGSLDWSKVTKVRIVFIGDYHD